MFTTTKKVSLVAAAVVLSLGVLAFGTGCGEKVDTKNLSTSVTLSGDLIEAVEVGGGNSYIAPDADEVTITFAATIDAKLTKEQAKALDTEADYSVSLKNADKAKLYLQGHSKHAVDFTIGEFDLISVTEKASPKEAEVARELEKWYTISAEITVNAVYPTLKDELYLGNDYTWEWSDFVFMVKKAAKPAEAEVAAPGEVEIDAFANSDRRNPVKMTVYPTITYDFGAYGDSISKLRYIAGETPGTWLVGSAPEAYIVMGAEFVGYFADPEFTIPFEATEISDNTTVYAQYKPLVVPETGDATPFAMAFAGLFAAAAIALFATRSLKKD